MAACGVPRVADFLSCVCQARQPVGECRRHCRPRSLEALLHDARGVARPVQRSSSSRTEGSRRNREGRLGAKDAAVVAPCLSRGESRTRTRRSSEASPHRMFRALLRRHSYRRARFSRGEETVGARLDERRLQASRPRASPDRTQPALAPRNAQGGHVALPPRSSRALLEQSGRTRWAHDEASPENLRRLPFSRRRDGLRHHSLVCLDRHEAGLEYHRRPDPRPIGPGEIAAAFVNGPANLGSYVEAIDPELGEMTIAFDGRPVTYAFGELDQIVLAYATTIHKSQGSEYPAVVIPVTTQHYMMLQRNLLYTGVTRGKRLVILLGQKKEVAIAVKNVSGRRRWSKLRKWLNPVSLRMVYSCKRSPTI